MAPRKVRLVVDLIRGLSVSEAETRLKFLNKDAALPVLKLLLSAVANAEHNFNLDKSTLVVKTITADAGVTIKRSRARAMGRSAPIRKRTSHINIVLAPKDEVKSRKSIKSVKSGKSLKSVKS
jgi:large subunit ribosomal protein L22